MSIKLASVHKDELHILRDLVDVMSKDETELDALTLTVMLKRAEVFMAEWRARVRAKANSEFVELQLAQPDQKTWAVGDLAMLTNYTPAGTWGYPEDITRMMTELAAKQEEAKKLKTAWKIPAATPDTKRATLFAITLKELPQ